MTATDERPTGLAGGAKMNVSLISITPDAEGHIARCARISHRSQAHSPTDDAKLIRKLVKLGHLSVLEHAQASFLVEGISRACLGQLTRHRHLSFTVESQRYVDQSSTGFVIPPSFQDRVEAMFVEAARAAYERLLSAGIPKEDARYLLPMGIETRLVLSGNFRALYEFIQKRSIPQAQWEIRELANRLLSTLLQEAPNVFGDLAPPSLRP